jgi:MFS family permease
MCRFFTGIGVGGEYTAIFAAVDELIPPNVRGRVDIILDGTWHLGSIIASLSTILIYSGVYFLINIFIIYAYFISFLTKLPYISIGRL